jgi:hypothetical protein
MPRSQRRQSRRALCSESFSLAALFSEATGEDEERGAEVRYLSDLARVHPLRVGLRQEQITLCERSHVTALLFQFLRQVLVRDPVKPISSKREREIGRPRGKEADKVAAHGTGEELKELDRSLESASVRVCITSCGVGRSCSDLVELQEDGDERVGGQRDGSQDGVSGGK